MAFYAIPSGIVEVVFREQSIAIFTSAEPRHVRGIRGFGRITPEQIKLIRTIPGLNRTTG